MEKQFETDEIEIDLIDLFYELLEEWKKILAATVLAGIIMFVLSAFIMTPQYESTSAIYIVKEDTSGSLSELQAGTSLAADYMVIIDSRPILDQVIANIGLDMTDSELRDMLSFSNPSNTRILEITVTHPDPAIAKAIVDQMADVAASYIQEKMVQEKPVVFQYGYVAEDPSSPGILKNTVIGAAVGAFLAIAVVVLTYLLNDTVMTPEDMERKIGLRTLASLPLDTEEDDGVPVQKKSQKKLENRTRSSAKSREKGVRK